MKLIQEPTEVGGPGRLALIFAYAEIGLGALSLRVNTAGDFAPRYEGDVGRYCGRCREVTPVCPAKKRFGKRRERFSHTAGASGIRRP
jgi:hypothetical protein